MKWNVIFVNCAKDGVICMTGGDWGQYMMAVACGSWINCIAYILMIVLEVCSVLLLESPQKYPYS